MTLATVDTKLLERAVAGLPDDALTPARREALARFAETGFPSVRHEDWRYTNLKPAVELSNRWLREAAARAPGGISDAVRDYAAELAARIDAHWLVVANGIVDPASIAALEQLELPGLDLSSMAAGGAVEALVSDMTQDPLSRFNIALLRDALRIRLGPNAALDKPLALLLVDDAEHGPAVSQARILVDAAESAKLDIIEHHASLGAGEHFANSVTDLKLARDASVNFVRIQQRHEQHYSVGRLSARLGRGAALNHTAFDTGGGLVRNDIAIDIAEPHASVALHGLYAAGGEQHIDNHTRIDHRTGPAVSVEEYRGILRDRAHCVFNGKAIVHAGADGTDAQQANHNLLLSDKAEIDTKPELEIYADDVKCSHGATVGQLDKTALFYLRSRGLAPDEAARMLTRAFAATIVGKTAVGGARDYVEALVEGRLRQLVDGSEQ
jgi:Fe-S cluster assembly protein SufD